MVGLCRLVDEAVYLGEWVRRDDVYRGKGLGKLALRGRAIGPYRLGGECAFGRMLVERREVENEQDETVFAAIVGKRELIKTEASSCQRLPAFVSCMLADG